MKEILFSCGSVAVYNSIDVCHAEIIGDFIDLDLRPQIKAFFKEKGFHITCWVNVPNTRITVYPQSHTLNQDMQLNDHSIVNLRNAVQQFIDEHCEKY